MAIDLQKQPATAAEVEAMSAAVDAARGSPALSDLHAHHAMLAVIREHCPEFADFHRDRCPNFRYNLGRFPPGLPCSVPFRSKWRFATSGESRLRFIDDPVFDGRTCWEAFVAWKDSDRPDPRAAGSVKCPDCGTWNQSPSDDTMYRCAKCQHDFLADRNATASATAMEPAERPPLVLALCLPMYRDITAETYECLSKFKDLPLPPGWRGMFEVPCRGQPVYLTREAIAAAALHGDPKPDVLLWVDSDCGVDDPAQLWALADRLAKAPPKVGLLAAPCRTRGFDKPTVNIDHFSAPTGGVADVWYSLDGTPEWPIPTHPDRATAEHPFVLVTKAGFGVIAMRREVLERVERPWFEMPWAKDPPPDATVLQRLVGEDTGFCLKARAAGFLVVADYSICAWHLEEVASRVPHPVAKPFSPAASWKRRVP